MSASDETSGGKRPLRDGIDTLRTQIGDATHGASDAYAAGIEKAGDAFADARERLAGATGGLADNPLAAVAGGIAVGLLIGALLPRSARETELYGALGERINAAARDAAGAARDASREKLHEMGISRENAGDTVRNIIDAALSAATSGANAAVDTARDRAGDIA